MDAQLEYYMARSLKDLAPVIEDFQTGDKEHAFALLLAKFDCLLVYLLNKELEKLKYLHIYHQDQELYHVAIVALSRSIRTFKKNKKGRYPVHQLPGRIRSYIRTELNALKRSVAFYQRVDVDVETAEEIQEEFVQTDHRQSMLEKLSRRELIEQMLDSGYITYQEKRIIKYRFYKEMIWRDIAQRLKISEATVMVKWRKLLVKLREYFHVEYYKVLGKPNPSDDRNI